MHATVQSGGRSPKPTSGPTSTSQLKSGSEVMQNSVSSFSSQVKGKKRERADQGSEPFKRERVSKTDDGGSGLSRQESFLKYEIGKIAENGGLVGTEGVEKLVQLMLQDRTEKKIDLAGRTMLAAVVAVTEKYECLSEFVQLRGLRVFDEWLQEVHKGKVDDGSGSKDTDKSVEEFLLILLRALDNLPVNLQALQMCNIGKSVNHLRSHKNSEIQKKARSLVDTWKKRVEAEMNINDMKGVSWPGRSRTEVGNRHSGGSSDVAVKSSVAQISGSKSAAVKIVHGDSTTRSASVSPGSIKSPSPASARIVAKEGHPRNAGGGIGMSDVPLTPARDEKSSSSSQSHNNSQSCSNDHTRNGVVSGKDDARSSSAGSMNVNKVSRGSSRPRKSANGFQGSYSGSHREIGSSRNSSLQKNKAVEKSSQSGLTSNKVLDGTNAEGNSHHNKLIVKIPNRGRSPAQNSGGSFEDPSIMSSRASSPAPSEKPDQSDRTSKEKYDAYTVTVTSEINAESWQSNDFKDVLTASDEGDGSPAAVADEERCRTGDVTKKVVEVAKTALSSSGNQPKPRNLQEACLSSMHALIESCVKHSEGNASVPAVDDVGMNLLASVAAGEITDSPQRNTPIKIASAGNNLKEKLLPAENLTQNKRPSTDGMVDRHGKPDSESGNAGSKDSEESLIKYGEKPVLESSPLKKSSSADFQKAEGCEESKGSKESVLAAAPAIVSPKTSERTTALETENKNEVIKNTVSKDEKPTTSVVTLKLVKGDSEDRLPSVSGRKIQETKTENSETVDMKYRADKSKSPKIEPERTVLLTPEIRVISEACPGVACTSSENMEHKMEAKETDKCLEPEKLLSTCDVQEAELVRSKASKLTVLKTDDAEECSSSGDSSSKFSVGVSDTDAKVGFDLNEGFSADDGKYSEPKNPVRGCSPAGNLISPLPFPVSSVPSGLPASITVTAAAAKGTSLPNKGEVGWKGSAATSAFRPAEPRKAQDLSSGAMNTAQPEQTTGKKRPLFDFDLNVPDERVLKDVASRYSGHDTSPQLRGRSTSATQVRSSGGLGLDLNEVDEAAETGNLSTSNASILQVKSSAAGGRMDFDLNDGPVVDEVSTDPAVFGHQFRSSVPSQIPALGLRLNNAEMGNFSSWFHSGPAFPAVSFQQQQQQQQPLSIITAGGPQRMMGGPTVPGNPFASAPEAYRGGPILSASPAMPFTSTSFQYPVFSYGTSFSMPPTTNFPGGPTTTTATYMDSSAAGGMLSFPAVHPQLMGPVGGVSSNYPRPYVISLQDGGISNSIVSESSRKWGRQGLDLNAGPGAPEIEVVRDESSGGLIPKQVSVSGFQALVDEQAARMFQFTGGMLKRKEPEGGWDGYSNKQPSWH